jgi:hypothetical protein
VAIKEVKMGEEILRLEHYADKAGSRKDLKFCAFLNHARCLSGSQFGVVMGNQLQMALEKPFQISKKPFQIIQILQGNLQEIPPGDPFAQFFQGFMFWSISMYVMSMAWLRVHSELESVYKRRTPDRNRVVH